MFWAEHGPDLLAARTDGAGRATIDLVPDTRCEFRVSKPGYAHARAVLDRPQPGERKVILTPGASISGTVRTPSGRPLAGARVTAGNAVADWRQTVTDSQGRFAFTDLVGKGVIPLPGDGRVDAYTVSFFHDDFVPEKTPHLEVLPGSRHVGVDLRAVPGTLVTGRLLEQETGCPIPGGWVTLTPKEKGPDSPYHHSHTDADGRFRFRTLLTGAAELCLIDTPRGWGIPSDGPGPRWITFNLDGRKLFTIDLHTRGRLVPLPRVRGKVLLPDGSPAAGAMVYPVPTARLSRSTENNAARPTSAGPDCSFELEHIPAGHPLHLYAEAQGRRFAFAGTVQVPVPPAAWPDPGTAEIGNLTLRPAATAELVLHDVEGKPLADYAVNVHPSFGERLSVFSGYVREERTDAAGRLRLEGVVPGQAYLVRDARQRLSVVGNEFPSASIAPLDAAGAPAVTRLMLDTRLAVRVLDAARKPVPVRQFTGARVWFDPHSNSVSREVPRVLKRLDDGWVLVDGRVIDDLAPGRRVELDVERDDGRKLTVACVYQPRQRLEFLTPKAASEVNDSKP